MPKLFDTKDDAVDGGDEVGGGDSDCDSTRDNDADDEHLETRRARLRGGGALESRWSLGRPDRSCAMVAVSVLVVGLSPTHSTYGCICKPPRPSYTWHMEPTKPHVYPGFPGPPWPSLLGSKAHPARH